MTPAVPKPKSRPKKSPLRRLHGHLLGYHKDCVKCRKRRAHNEAVAKRALLKQRAKSRTAIRRKGKPRFAKGRDPNFLKWIRGMFCLEFGHQECHGPTEAAHIRTRGAGGVDLGNVLPLCDTHHRRQHTIGIRSFAVRYHGSLDKMMEFAQLYVKQYEKAVALGWKPGDA